MSTTTKLLNRRCDGGEIVEDVSEVFNPLKAMKP